MIWFTADTHFGHANIIEYQKDTRPFTSIEEHDEALIHAWNTFVRKNDTVYHLGDFCYWKAKVVNPADYIRRLNGMIYLCLGNHDADTEGQIRRLGMMQWVGHVKYIRYNGSKFFLSHYPHRAWRSSHHGSYHLFGHTHGKLPGWGRSMDVGVDACGLRPISVDQVIEKLKDQPFTHHHPDDLGDTPEAERLSA